MYPFYHRSIIICFLLLSVICAEAQPPQGAGKKQGPTIEGKVTGRLVDTLNGQPIAYATIVLVDQASKKQLNGGLSSDNGKFKLTEVKNGKYQLVISFIGYQEKTISFESTLEKPDVNLDDIFLLNSGVTLDEVVVAEEAKIVENRIDRIVYNADKDASLAGGDAADVLQKVPLLSVDLEGNVSLRGSSNLQILINGKPSGMFSADVADALKMISADQIKSVEVITTPTAKYDGEGSAGIINIITKKKTADGFNGSVGGSIGTRQNDAKLNLNWVKGRFGINTATTIRYSWPRDGTNYFLREDYKGDTTNILEQNGISESSRIGFGGTIGAFYDFNAFNSVTSSFNLRGRSFDRSGNTMAVFSTPIINFEEQYDRFNDNEDLRSGYDWTTEYRRTFRKKEQELSFGLQFTGNISTQDVFTNQTSLIEELRLRERSTNDGNNLETTFQIDYVHPFGENIKLEVGAKSILREIDSDYSFELYDFSQEGYFPNTALTDRFDYDQDVYAGYTSMNFKLGENYGLVAGARYEHTNIKGVFASDGETFKNDYDNILPSIIINRKFKNFSSIKTSYVQRIQRPSLYYINPYQNNSDRRNVTFGNPDLQPEISHLIEFGYNTFFKGISVNAAVYYRLTTDVIERFVHVDSDGVSINTFRNIGENNSVGLNLFTSANLKKKLSIRFGFNVYTYNAEAVVAGEKISNEGFMYNGNLGGSYAFKNNFKIETFGFFRSRRLTLQGKVPSFSILTFGLKKEFLDERLAVGIRIVEPFKVNKSFNSELEQKDVFYQINEFSIPFQSFGISLNYKFGNVNNKGPRRKRSKINNDDTKGGEDSQF